MNKIIPYGQHNITNDDIKSVIKVLKSSFLTQGPTIKDFEKKFSKYVGSKYSVAVSNGTAALHISCLALGVKKGTKVICPTITFAASANCIRYCNGDVVFFDIDEKSLLLNISSLEKYLIQNQINGVIAVNLSGKVLQLDLLKKLSDKYGFWIIEDACHSPGGFFKDIDGNIQLSGNGLYSDISIFSFHPVKHIAAGEGGMITTNNKTLYEKILKLRSHGIIKNRKELINLNYNGNNHPEWYYELQELGFNFRITDIQAALGISQLKRAKKNLNKRKVIAKLYNEFFKKKKYIIEHSGFEDGHAYHLYIIQVKKRDELFEYLKSKNIICQVHYYPLHKMPYYVELYGNKSLPKSELYIKQCLSIPIYPELELKDIRFILHSINDFYEK
jgi:UDP-4-amino-4,6-dideoxy-N-acetyl-beta-L-altrosamine transaminase